MDGVSEKILDTLQTIGRPCLRHDLAGQSELTIKRLAAPLDALVERGAVIKTEDGLYTLSRLEQERRKEAC